MRKENTYTLFFKGETQSGFEAGTVKENIARLFGVHESEVSPLFEGKSLFERRGLNQFTANQYIRKLRETGALCYLEEDVSAVVESAIDDPIAKSSAVNKRAGNVPTDNNRTRVETNLCPKCRSANINAEQCLDCGVYFEKLRKAAMTPAGSVSLSPDNYERDGCNDDEDFDYLENMQKAIRIIKYVTIYLLAVFTIDNYFLDNQQSLRYVVDPGLDFGIIPYLLGHIGLVWGCYYLALAKGRSGLWGGLGLASLPGLSVLLLLPDEHAASSDGKTKLFAIAMIFLSVYWLTDYANKSAALTRYIEESLVLREQRHEYPSIMLDTEADIFESEIDELNAYLDQGFGLLSEYDYRPRQVYSIAEAMFSETMRLFIWINYQQYLQYRNGERGADYLQDKNVVRSQTEVLKRIKQGVETNRIFSLSQAYEEWFIGTYYEGAYGFLNTFNSELMDRRIQLIQLSLLSNDKVTPPELSLENIERPEFSNVKVSTKEDIMLFDFSEHAIPAVDEPLAIASFYRSYKRYSLSERREVDRYFLVQVQISPDFPNKYLASDFSVFRPVDINPLLNQR